MSEQIQSHFFKAFSEEISKRSDLEKWVFEFTDRASYRYPSISRDIGDLIVYDDQEELTLAIENIYHTHFNPEFGPSFDRSTKDKDAAHIAKEAVAFIDEILSDRMILWICYLNEQPFSGGACPVDEIDDVPEEAICYLWSGKIVPER